MDNWKFIFSFFFIKIFIMVLIELLIDSQRFSYFVYVYVIGGGGIKQ